MASEAIRASLRSSTSSNGVSASDPFHYPSIQNKRTHDVFQSIVKGRKSWKTLRGGEIVWPPELEAALLEGLESYQPDDSRETRLLGRFPMRNRFISDYIFEKTKKRRSAKQVGSRLQQLRDTCGGKRLLNLISPRRPTGPPTSRSYYANQHGSSSHRAPPCDSDSASDVSSMPTTPTDTNFQGNNPSDSQTVVYIDILPENANGLYQPPNLDDWSRTDIVRASRYPRPLRTIDPTVTLISQSPTSASSLFTVMSSGAVIHTETTTLTSAGPAPDRHDGALLYSTTLVPEFWDKLINSLDPTQYTIYQEVVQDDPIVSLFSAVYKFNYPSGTGYHLAHSPSMSDNSDNEVKIPQDLQNFDCLLPMDAPFPDMICENMDSYYDFVSLDVKQGWDAPVRSPSEISTDLSGYAQSHCSGEQDDDLLSPVSSAYPPALMNYVS